MAAPGSRGFGNRRRGSRSSETLRLLGSCDYLGAAQDSRLERGGMNSLRVLSQVLPRGLLWRRMQIPRPTPVRPCSLYTCTYKTRNRA
ncbi:carbonic anhydrase 5B, mitochondrial-like [Tamandua tetradactyla]|uniref:carbonic anhydrase 5B, mitochondrial-like n=1 Tax=Tamandua tetradactyla TaxID=48850 RepID=UPI004053A0D9